MHVRASLVSGMPIVDDAVQEVAGFLGSPLIDPDTGRIEGFFVTAAGLAEDPFLFLQSPDIVAWGTRVHVRSADVLCPPSDIIRLAARLADHRPFLGQKMRIKSSGRRLGTLSDVQFDTRKLSVEWLFPRVLWFFPRPPIPAGEVDEVTEDAIWIKDPLKPERGSVKSDPEEAIALQPMTTPGV